MKVTHEPNTRTIKFSNLPGRSEFEDCKDLTVELNYEGFSNMHKAECLDVVVIPAIVRAFEILEKMATCQNRNHLLPLCEDANTLLK
jgi:hypothetical protein